MVRAAEGRGLTVPDPEMFEALPGLGVRARADGSLVTLGRPRSLAEKGIKIDGEIEARTTELAAPGRTVILAATG
ncbi:hypothetical protein WAJ73_23625, partial [Acinetobacter baumannii]